MSHSSHSCLIFFCKYRPQVYWCTIFKVWLNNLPRIMYVIHSISSIFMTTSRVYKLTLVLLNQCKCCTRQWSNQKRTYLILSWIQFFLEHLIIFCGSSYLIYTENNLPLVLTSIVTSWCLMEKRQPRARQHCYRMGQSTQTYIQV